MAVKDPSDQALMKPTEHLQCILCTNIMSFMITVHLDQRYQNCSFKPGSQRSFRKLLKRSLRKLEMRSEKGTLSPISFTPFLPSFGSQPIVLAQQLHRSGIVPPPHSPPPPLPPSPSPPLPSPHFPPSGDSCGSRCEGCEVSEGSS